MSSLPLFFPLLPNRVWRTYTGGEQLDRMEGKPNPADSHFPEDWILSTTVAVNRGREEFREEGLSKTRVDGQDRYLRDLFREQADTFLGEAHRAALGTDAGFLLKYLDSAVRLHLQCHPTIEFSRRHLNANAGKTEGYVILGHRPGVEPYLYLGFQRPPDPARLRKAIVEQDTEFLLSCFDRIPVRAGDVFLAPGGLPHAIGEGILMIEIMEPTDFAVRLEFERGGYVLPEAARFMGRDVDFAISMLDFTAYDVATVRDRFFMKPLPLAADGELTRESLFDARSTPCFRMERLRVTGCGRVRHSGFRALIVTSGSGRARAGGVEATLRAGDRWMIAHAAEELELDAGPDGLELILALPPTGARV